MRGTMDIFLLTCSLRVTHIWATQVTVVAHNAWWIYTAWALKPGGHSDIEFCKKSLGRFFMSHQAHFFAPDNHTNNTQRKYTNKVIPIRKIQTSEIYRYFIILFSCTWSAAHIRATGLFSQKQPAHIWDIGLSWETNWLGYELAGLHFGQNVCKLVANVLMYY